MIRPLLQETLPPLPQIPSELNSRLAAINACRRSIGAHFFNSIRDVVVIASSSRGGSSIFTEIVRRSPDLLLCKGEITPFLNLAGLTPTESGYDSDHLPPEAADVLGPQQHQLLEREIAMDVGCPGPVDLRDQQQLRQFSHDLHWRLTCQWPQLSIDSDYLHKNLNLTLDELHLRHGWKAGEFLDPQLFHVLLLARIRQRYPQINPWYYDLSPDLIRKFCPDIRIDYSPPGDLVIEEPPFVTIAPNPASFMDFDTNRTLVLKTPSNIYRLGFLRRLFPRARFRILHLIRHPAAAINGLVDGWLHHGFFSQQLKNALRIKGYSDQFPDWGHSWWKFDLPPNWRQYARRSLVEVCAFQWRSAHEETQRYLKANGLESIRVRFEDALGSLPLRKQTFTKVAEWLGVDPAPLIKAATGDLPPVMATCRPRMNRWFKNAPLLRPVLNNRSLQQIASSLGYFQVENNDG